VPIEGSHILLGVSGCLSAYKACDLVRSLTRAGASVRVALSEGAQRYVARLTFETLSQHDAIVDDLQGGCLSMAHVEAARWADVLVIAPATPSVLAKLAHGIADELLPSLYIAFTGPVVLAPAMNAAMLGHPTTRANLEILGAHKKHIIPPRSPEMTDGEISPPTMASLEDLMKAIAYSLGGAQDLEGRRFLVTGGPTREHIDPVRFLSNPSSGRMGLALVEEARKRGASVTFVHGPLTDAPSRDVEAIPVTSVVEMHERVLERLSECDVLISAATPGDFVPEERQAQKIKKDSAGTVTIKLKRAPDILGEAARRRCPGQILVGFTTEVDHLVDNAKKKLKEKDLDIVVATDATGGTFGPMGEQLVDFRKVVVACRNGAIEEMEPQDKRRVARYILDRVRELLDATARKD